MKGKKSMLLNREAILKAEDAKFQDVDVPEWGGVVRVRAISGADRDEYEGFVAGDRKSGKLNMRHMRARLLVLALVDEEGQRLFKLGDLESLSNKNAAVIDRLFDVASELAGITEAAKDEAEENFQFALNGHSTLS